MKIQSIANYGYQPHFSGEIMGTPSVKYAIYHAEDLVNKNHSLDLVKRFYNSLKKIKFDKETGDIMVYKNPVNNSIIVKQYSTKGRVQATPLFVMASDNMQHGDKEYASEGYNTMQAIITCAENLKYAKEYDTPLNNGKDIIKQIYTLMSHAFGGFNIKRP